MKNTDNCHDLTQSFFTAKSSEIEKQQVCNVREEDTMQSCSEDVFILHLGRWKIAKMWRGI